MKFFQQKKGFTLIEILIVISVIAIISVSGIAALSTFQTNQLMNVTAKDLVSMLNLAKSRARTQVKPSDCVSPQKVLDGYEVRLICPSGFNPNCGGPDAGYEMIIKCGNLTYISTTKLKKIIPTGYSFVAGSAGSLFFPILKGGVETAGDIIISNGSGLTKTVSVDASGNINIE